MARPWFLYVLACQGGGLYTGVTPDVARRWAAHLAGKGARYTRSFPPQQLALVVEFASKGEALSAERAVKAMRAADKRAWLLSCGGQLPQPHAGADAPARLPAQYRLAGRAAGRRQTAIPPPQTRVRSPAR